MLLNGLSDASTHPPTHADRARSGGANSRSVVFGGEIFFKSSSTRFAKSTLHSIPPSALRVSVTPPASRTFEKRSFRSSKSHAMMVSNTSRDTPNDS